MENQNYSVAVIGLGSMGMGAAVSCINAGLTTYGIDLNPVALEKLKAAGAKAVAANGYDFAHELDAVVILVVNAAQANAVLFGKNGIAKKLKAGTAVMVSSTMAAQDAQIISQKLTELGLIMLDAPVSGGAAKALKGEMTVMASGSKQAFELLQPVLDATAAKVYNIGVVTNAAGNSWMFENRMKHVVEGDYTPLSMVDIFVKDLGLVNDTAKSLHFPLHLASTAYSMFTEASNAGYGKEDDSAVIKIFSGVNLPKKGA